MLASTETTSLLLLLNLGFAVIALAIGFFAGAWFAASRKQSASDADGAALSSEKERQEQLERERTAMATERLRDVATAVAADLGEHSQRVGEITNDLKGLDTDDFEATGAGLVDALAKIVAANEGLQQKLQKAEEQIEAQAREIHLHETEARTDSLTGLANRRAFDDEMTRRYAEATRRSEPLSLLIMDIDYFKKFNDTHGHQAGDEVLRAVGEQLARTCRDMDLPCRYGGEEFAVVMPATSIADATVAAERIRTAVEETTVNFEGKQLKVTASIGLAQLSADDDIARLLRRADDALYESKDAGRNCGHLHDGEACMPFTPRIVDVKADLPCMATPKVTTQTLAQLPNRTKFAEELRRRMAEANRTDQAIAVLLVELDSHEAIREKFGAEVGGAALDAVASVFQQSLREMDLFARMGDNRFAALLPENTADSAMTVGQRVIATLKECPLEINGETVELRIALGGAHYGTGDTVEKLVGRAEAEMADSGVHLAYGLSPS